jgi:hypothetical protein
MLRTQESSANLSFTVSRALSALVFLTAVSLVGCGGDAVAAKCSDPAKTESCTCADGNQGMRACSTADAGNACVCPSGSGADGGKNTAGTSGSQSGVDGGTGAGAGKDHDAAVSGSGDDGGATGNGTTDSGTGNGTPDSGTGNGTVSSYSGPCNTDKGCPGKEICVHTGKVSYCAATCMKNSDCPDPSDGKATPTCVNANILLGQPGNCALNCGGLLAGECPAGMACSDLLLLSGECAWQGTI